MCALRTPLPPQIHPLMSREGNPAPSVTKQGAQNRIIRSFKAGESPIGDPRRQPHTLGRTRDRSLWSVPLRPFRLTLDRDKPFGLSLEVSHVTFTCTSHVHGQANSARGNHCCRDAFHHRNFRKMVLLRCVSAVVRPVANPPRQVND